MHGYQVSSFSGFPPGNEATKRFFPLGIKLLRLFMPQAAEESRIHTTPLLAEATWSCLSSEKIRDQKNHRSKTKNVLLELRGLPTKRFRRTGWNCRRKPGTCDTSLCGSFGKKSELPQLALIAID